MSDQHQQQSSQSAPDSQDVHFPPPNRRSLLQWLTHGLGALFALIIGAPAVAFLIDPRNRQASSGTFTKLVNFDRLEVNKPQEFVIRQTFRDAWTLHPNEIVGRVLLVRKPGNEHQVEAFNTVCPHLGCSIKINQDATPESDIFICPCHGGRFLIDGERCDPAHNPATRGMYELECKIDATDNMVEVKYERPNKNAE